MQWMHLQFHHRQYEHHHPVFLSLWKTAEYRWHSLTTVNFVIVWSHSLWLILIFRYWIVKPTLQDLSDPKTKIYTIQIYSGKRINVLVNWTIWIWSIIWCVQRNRFVFSLVFQFSELFVIAGFFFSISWIFFFPQIV